VFLDLSVPASDVPKSSPQKQTRACVPVDILVFQPGFFSLSADMHCTFVAETPAFMITINAD
jgi:hypothetical protein